MPVFRSLKELSTRTPLYDAWVSLRLRREWRQWEQRGRRPPAPHALKQQTILETAERFQLRRFIETGTYMGTMLSVMVSRFDRADSIELDPYLAERARQRFRKWDHVAIHRGDSTTVLPEILSDLSGPALFWLDAHFSGGITSRGILETPIGSEVRAVLAHNDADRHAILIDDARLFDGTHDYPRLDELCSLVTELAPSHSFRSSDDIIRILPS